MKEDISPYLREARGEIFVIKYGGSFMDSPDPAAREGVARTMVSLQAAGVRAVVVHGGGKAITRALEKAGLKTEFIQGMRVTNEETVRVVDQVLSREINPEIVATIGKLGGKARGFAGTEIFTCRRLGLRDKAGADVDIGFVGDVTAARTEGLREAIDSGIIPVISPTATGEDGKVYNCNADVAAAQAAMALRARRLIFMSDVPGLLRDPKDPGTLIPRLALGDVAGLKKAGVIDQGMIPKVDSAVAAYQAGVAEVSFVDGRANEAALWEIFSRQDGAGTILVS